MSYSQLIRWTLALGNGISLVHRNGYFIPKESSIYKFQETKYNVLPLKKTAETDYIKIKAHLISDMQ